MNHNHHKLCKLAIFLLAGTIQNSWGINQDNRINAINYQDGKTKLSDKKITDEDNKNSSPVLSADHITHNSKSKVIDAWGNVEIFYQNRYMKAEKISYNQNNHLIKAIGNVQLIDDKGNISFADTIELGDNLDKAQAADLRMILPDESKMAANYLTKDKQGINKLDQVVYSPCLICKKDPNYDPLWQIRSRHTIWDEAGEDIIHTDAVLDIKGVPVMYLPYFRHPAPNVDRRSGILAPIFGSISNIGIIAGLPYYYVISADQDITITPLLTGNRPMIMLAYRRQFCNGFWDADLSLTQNKFKRKSYGSEKTTDRLRGHIKTTGQFDLTSNSRVGFNIKRALDDTYLKKYNFIGIKENAFLSSKIYSEHFSEKSYATLEADSFQGLREADHNRTIPLIAPSAQVNYVSKPHYLGGELFTNGSALNLMRQKGTEVQRFSVTTGWRKIDLLNPGLVWENQVTIRQDLYHINHYIYRSDSTKYSGTQTRFFPQFLSNLKYPLITFIKKMKVIVEPIIGIIIAPQKKQNIKIPNEDSNLFELSDTNLFSSTRFSGLDAVESGSRVMWGLNNNLLSAKDVNANFFFGQSYAFNQTNELHKANTGLDHKLSDYVARLIVNYTSWVSFESRSLIDRKHLKAERQEAIISVGQPILKLSTIYSYIPKVTVPKQKSEQISYQATSQLNSNWQMGLTLSRELGRRGGKLEQGVILNYNDECFRFESSLRKSYFSDRDVKAGTTVMFRLVFKTLGEVKISGKQMGLNQRKRSTANSSQNDEDQSFN